MIMIWWWWWWWWSRAELRKFSRELKKVDPSAELTMEYDKLDVGYNLETRVSLYSDHVSCTPRSMAGSTRGVTPRTQSWTWWTTQWVGGYYTINLLKQTMSTVAISASNRSIRRFIITEKAPTRAFSWLKAATTAFTFKTLLRHYAKQALTPRSGLVSIVSYSRMSLMIIA